MQSSSRVRDNLNSSNVESTTSGKRKALRQTVEEPISCFKYNVLEVFDVREETRDFLADIIRSCPKSPETQLLVSQTLLAGAEDWQNLVDCATAIHRSKTRSPGSLDSQDVLPYIAHILDGENIPTSRRPWEQTDNLIARARELQWSQQSVSAASRTKYSNTTSHYWTQESQLQESSSGLAYTASPATQHDRRVLSNNFPTLASIKSRPSAQSIRQVNHEPKLLRRVSDKTIVGNANSKVSPYFVSPPSDDRRMIGKRPPRGIVSSLPFAPLTAPSFGLIQEELAYEPFWLLLAVTFLIKTKGTVAIPVFRSVRERFPNPHDIQDPVNTTELIDMIRHLGLSCHRTAIMQKYARGFLENPPTRDKRYKVCNYDRRVSDPRVKISKSSTQDITASQTKEEDLGSWEIGHLTQGKYAIDSWRIFCRDELLGQAQDWQGKGREPSFQPEWMRVMPEDKELRAYLRWMWMKEGWEWDPVTGDRQVLREELLRAVNECRVEFDDVGGLRILPESRLS